MWTTYKTFITMPSYRIPELLLFLCCCLPMAAKGQSAASGPYPPGIDLPEGENRQLVLSTCTRCHDLRGVPAYKGYWNRQQWFTMVDTMVKHGAAVTPGQAGLIADYLNEHFGRRDGPNQEISR